MTSEDERKYEAEKAARAGMMAERAATAALASDEDDEGEDEEDEYTAVDAEKDDEESEEESEEDEVRSHKFCVELGERCLLTWMFRFFVLRRATKTTKKAKRCRKKSAYLHMSSRY